MLLNWLYASSVLILQYLLCYLICLAPYKQYSLLLLCTNIHVYLQFPKGKKFPSHTHPLPPRASFFPNGVLEFVECFETLNALGTSVPTDAIQVRKRKTRKENTIRDFHSERKLGFTEWIKILYLVINSDDGWRMEFQLFKVLTNRKRIEAPWRQGDHTGIKLRSTLWTPIGMVAHNIQYTKWLYTALARIYSCRT